ncbi:hypothetical protein GF338_04225, partial [candidate division WOR-3 bacterium]|nr:hypothetical protein [candidate division WOR-3 bacterium]
MKHRIWFDKNAGIIRVRLVGEVTPDCIERVLASCRHSDCQKVMIDYSRSMINKRRFSNAAVHANQIVNSVFLRKHAVVGASPMTRGMAQLVSFLLNLSKSSRFFTAEEDAVS